MKGPFFPGIGRTQQIAPIDDWQLLAVDDEPNVAVGGHEGFRVVLRRSWKEYINPPQQAAAPSADPAAWKSQLKTDDWEFVLVPDRAKQVPVALKSQIKWKDRKCPYHTRDVCLGTGHGYVWFTHGTIFDQEHVRESLKLKGGDDRIQLVVDGVLVKDSLMQTAEACMPMPARFGDRAIPYIKRAVEQSLAKPRKTGLWRLVATLGYIPTSRSTETLLQLFDFPNAEVRSCAETGLCHKPYRKAAKRAYLDMLRRNSRVRPVAGACVEFEWTEAIPLLRDVVARPRDLQDLRAVLVACRSLEGNPIARELLEAEAALRWTRPDPDADQKRKIDSARRLLIQSDDAEAANLAALWIAIPRGKRSSSSPRFNAIGIEILKSRPRESTLAFLKAMADSIQGHHGRLIKEIQVAVAGPGKETSQAPQIRRADDPRFTIANERPRALGDPPPTTAPSPAGLTQKRPVDRRADPVVEWGQAVKGLQAGISYNNDSAESVPGHVRVGDRVSTKLTVRNVGKVAISFTTVGPVFRRPTITDTTGKPLHVSTVAYDGPAARLKHQLKPSESMTFDFNSCSVAPRRPIYNTDGGHFFAGPGKYKVSATLFLHRINKGDWTGRLDAGTLDLEVIPPNEEKLTRRVSFVLKKRANELNCRVVYLGLAEPKLRSVRLLSPGMTESIRPHWSTARIDRTTAIAIIDCLAKEGHLWRAVAEPESTAEWPQTSYFLAVEVGSRPHHTMMIPLPWSSMKQQIQKLQQAVSGDAADALAKILDQPLLSEWHHVVAGKLIGVSVEPVLYERKDDPHFYMRIRLTNRTKKDVFVDLTGYDRVFHPNQWGFHASDERMIINERRIQPGVLTPAQKQDLTDRARNEQLTRIAPGQSVDYFREFNASGRKDVEAQQKNWKYLIVSIDGQLHATDGSACENVNVEWHNESANELNSDVAIAAPVAFKSMPVDSRVVEP